MKTIFVNDIPIHFKELDNLNLKKEDYDTHIDGSSGVVPKKLYSRVLIYDSSIETIVDLLKKMTKHKFKKIYSITITLKHLKRVIKNVKKMFKIVKAGGGVVENINSEILFIYRMKKWDLPKGKLDKGETIMECAKREVEEETSIDLTHYNLVSENVFKSISKFNDLGVIPVINGILTTENINQAKERIKNGIYFADACIHMIKLNKDLT